MKCPFCGNLEDRVVDSRVSPDYTSIRRRRECLSCGKRFTTRERVEMTPLVVIKKDGKREFFQREKLKAGIMKACEKRPISMEKIEELVEKISTEMRNRFYVEVPSQEIGGAVMKGLYELDKVAYVRFASVYREFKDVGDFLREVKDIEKGGRDGNGRK